jgi:hypothetical protein
MVSRPGASEYSTIIIVYLTPPSTSVTRVGPNPFHHILEVGLYLPAGGKLAIQLTDCYGRKIKQETLQAPKGFYTYIMSNTRQLMPGVYVLTVDAGGELHSFKVLKE